MERFARRQFGLLILMLAAALAFAAQGASGAPTPPSTLTGESMQVFSGDPAFAGTTQITGTCNQTSPSNFTFTASGVAIGPYPGPFTASGSYTLAPNPSSDLGTSRAITNFSESFEIDAPDGTVTGTKTEASTLPPSLGGGLLNEGQCLFDGQRSDVTTGNLASTYTATINTGSGPNYHDEGASATGLSQYDTTDQTPPGTNLPHHTGNFQEYFLSSLPATTPTLPTSKDQCKHDGWQTYGVFKNQGDCVSYVATGGKNPPSNG